MNSGECVTISLIRTAFPLFHKETNVDILEGYIINLKMNFLSIKKKRESLISRGVLISGMCTVLFIDESTYRPTPRDSWISASVPGFYRMKLYEGMKLEVLVDLLQEIGIQVLNFEDVSSGYTEFHIRVGDININ